jgi:uncharacterized membrane protein YcaP (DUF421 family)
MEEIIFKFFGEGKDLNALQMCSRSLVVFLFALILIRISGRRSFGIRTPLDNIIVILLGTVLGRGIVGASPFVPVVIASLLIVLIHRAFGWLIVHSEFFADIIEGKKILLFKDDSFIKENMDKALVCEEDVMQGVRKSALTNDLNKIKEIYIERNGEISPVKK